MKRWLVQDFLNVINVTTVTATQPTQYDYYHIELDL